MASVRGILNFQSRNELLSEKEYRPPTELRPSESKTF